MIPNVAVFDLGKVLLHFDYAIAAARFQQRCSKPAAIIQEAIDQSPLLHQFETNQLSTEEFFAALKSTTGFAGNLEEFSDIFCDVFSPIEPMISVHAELRERGVPTYIFSNTNFLQIGHIRRQFGFFQNFDGYILSCEHGVMKPDHRLYEVVERITGRRGGEILYVDDRLENVVAGQERGWRAIHFTNPDEAVRLIRDSGLLP